jgi:hypothetical protein
VTGRRSARDISDEASTFDTRAGDRNCSDRPRARVIPRQPARNDVPSAAIVRTVLIGSGPRGHRPAGLSPPPQPGPPRLPGRRGSIRERPPGPASRWWCLVPGTTPRSATPRPDPAPSRLRWPVAASRPPGWTPSGSGRLPSRGVAPHDRLAGPGAHVTTDSGDAPVKGPGSGPGRGRAAALTRRGRRSRVLGPESWVVGRASWVVGRASRAGGSRSR